jgi:hypothetical protein
MDLLPLFYYLRVNKYDFESPKMGCFIKNEAQSFVLNFDERAFLKAGVTSDFAF